ncbi:shikimate dehydrogenase family protein [Burkholderia gladioli]|uniref:shikimate dehydrogenase family protein n=1 Tax=Burkholderia gladioli TaxID=28095 RepID=UPI00164084BE|nr:shikimate dehydrogenase [Burkholderia gladioli]
MTTVQGIPGPLSGSTRVYAIVGDPIAQVASPRLFNTAFRERSADAVLVPLHVAPDALREVIDSFRAIRNFDGLVVTVPHKIAATEWVDELGPQARLTGALNTIRKTEDGRLIGENFDGEGFIRGLASRGQTLTGRRVLVIGAGGAGCAVAHAVAAAGADAIGVFDIDTRRCRALADGIKTHRPGLDVFEAKPDAQGFDVIVNCTSIGMRPDDPLPLDITHLAGGALVADIILKPVTTPLLLAASERGCAIHQGPAMLEGQIDAVLDFFAVRAQT